MSDPTVSLESISLEAEVLSASGPVAGSAYVRLEPSGQFRPVEFECVVLDNGLVRATVCPALGGRLVALRDLRTGSDLIKLPTRIESSPGGLRGRVWENGLVLATEGTDRPNALGPMVWAVRDGEAASDHAALFVFEVVLGSGLSVTVCWAVPRGRAEILVECKATNRTGEPQKYRPSWVLAGTWETAENAEGLALCRLGTDLGMQVCGQVQASQEGGLIRIVPGLTNGNVLGPWQTHTDTLRLVPLAGLGLTNTYASGVAVRVSGDALSLQANRPLTVVATLALAEGPEQQARIELGGPPLTTELPSGILRARVETEDAPPLEWPDQRPPVRPPESSGLAQAWADPQPGSAEELLISGTLAAPTPGLEGAFHAAVAERAFQRGDFAAAHDAWTAAVAHLPENECLWWALAHARAMIGEDPSDVLANAHFLGPMEPLLRAEAFLSSPVMQGSEPSPLLLPLVNNPDSLLDVVGRLLALGDRAVAGRLAEESLRHAEIPLLRWLHAWNLLTGSRLDAEAALHAAKAASSPPAPPLPWRPIERTALTETLARFPDLEGAQPWAELLG